MPTTFLRLLSSMVLTGLVACATESAAPAGSPAGQPDAGVDTPPGSDASADAAPAPDADAPPDAKTPTDWKEAFAKVLPDDHVVDLRLQFAAGAWANLLAQWQSAQQKVEAAAALTFDQTSLPAVGVRLKGLNTLEAVPKAGPVDPKGRYPLKIDFDSQGGPRLHGVDELNLNSARNDPSWMREALTSRMYTALGVPAPRTAYADVRIDGVHVGPYVLVQDVDKRFLKERLGTAGDADDGNLYKCVPNAFDGCSLQWQGADKAAYVRTQGCMPGFATCGLVQQTNEDDPAQNGYQDLVHFLDVLHHTDPQALPAELPKVFDVDGFLRLAAVAHATANYDSYFGKGNNYFLYHRADGRFQMIPWDFDHTYGSACEGDAFDPCGMGASRPLTHKILAVPAWRQAYLGYLQQVASQHLTPEQHGAWMAHLDGLVAPYVANDPNAPPSKVTYAQAKAGLLEYVAGRRAWILGKVGK